MNPHDTLGVNHNADEAEIKRAYRKLAKKHHPDSGGDSNRFIAIRQAYEALHTPIEKEAEQLVSRLFINTVAQLTSFNINNVVEHIEAGLDRIASDIKRDTGINKNKVTRLKKVQGRVHCKDGKDLFNAELETQISIGLGEIKKLDRQQLVTKAAYLIVGNYEDHYNEQIND